MDVNGDLEMTGGELYVNGPQSGGDGALDYDGSFTLTGGTVVAVDDIGTVHINWDNGSGLNVIYGIDIVRKAAD